MNYQSWVELASAACDQAGIQPESIEVIRTWEKTQNTVYWLGDQRYSKLYHRIAKRQFAVECAALQTLAAAGIPNQVAQVGETFAEADARRSCGLVTPKQAC